MLCISLGRQKFPAYSEGVDTSLFCASGIKKFLSIILGFLNQISRVVS
jgi:hypothetical protein